MKISLLIAIAVSFLLIAAVWLIYLNRASEKIVSAAVPIAAASLLALGLSVFVFGADQPQSQTFIASYTLITNTKKLDPNVMVCKQNGEFASGAIDAIFALQPKVLTNPNDPNAIQLYNHLLQWEIMRRISMMFRKDWRTEVFTLNRYNTRFIRAANDANGDREILTSDQVREILKDNRFSFFSSGYDQVMPFQIALPRNTTVEVIAPHDSFKRGENQGTITFLVDQMALLGPLYNVTIITRPLSTGQGSFGYRKYTGKTETEDRELFTYLYEVEITTSTNRLRSGSPALAGYKRWINGMIDALRDQLDDERIYERNRRDGCLLTNQE